MAHLAHRDRAKRPTVILAVVVMIACAAVGFSLTARAATTRGLVASSGSPDSVTVFDLATGDAVTITYAFFNKPRWVAITDDGRFAGVTNANGPTITWLDLRNRDNPPSILGKTDVGSSPKGIAIKGAIAVVAVDDPTAGNMDSVKIIAIGGLPGIPRATEITSLNLGKDANPEGVAITPDGRFALVVQTGLSSIAYLDLTGLTPTLLAATTPVGSGAFGVAVTPDSRTAFVTNKTAGTLSVIDLRKLSVIDISGFPTVPDSSHVTTILTGNSPQGVAISEDGSKAVIAEAGSADDGRIATLPALTSNTVSMKTAQAPDPNPFGVAISLTPDGPRAAIANEGAGTVSILDLATHTVVMTVPVGPGPRGLAITPVQLPDANLKATSPPSGKAPLTVTFDASGSSDPDGTVFAYTFDFGDGTSVTTSDAVVTHTYQSAGSFTARLAVTDDDGASSINEAKVGIAARANRSPKASLSASPTSGKAPLRVTLDGSRSADSDGTIVSYTFTFGDRTSVTTSTPIVTHTYASAGKFVAGLVVTDDNGAPSTSSAKNVQAIANTPPTANLRMQPTSGNAPLTVTFTNQSKDSDGQIVAVKWDFGDGAASSEQNPTHTYTRAGKFVVTLTVTDDNGATAQKTGKMEVR